MGVMVSVGLVILAAALFGTVKKGWIDNKTLEILADVAAVVALIAAAIVFIVPTPTMPETRRMSSSPTLVDYVGLDQFHSGIDYALVFGDDIVRWQEFIPSVDYLTAIELFIQKSGNPGNIIVEIRTASGEILDRKVISEADTPHYGWLRIDYSDYVSLTPGERYRIFVFSDSDVRSEDHRYAWRGGISSMYCNTCMNDVIVLWPYYVYAFKTFGHQR